MPDASASPPPDLRRTARARAERRLVGALLASLALTIVLLIGFGTRASVARRDARVRADRTFARAGLVQLEFHARRGRFAFWSELASEGMRLPQSMQVDTSNATASHWYLRLRDSATGLLCDRVGQRLDRPGSTTNLSCRAP